MSNDEKKSGLNPGEVWKDRQGGIKQKSEELEQVKVALTEEKEVQLSVQDDTEEVEEFVDDLSDIEEEDYDELDSLEEDKLKVAEFNTLWSERRKCFVPVMDSHGGEVHIPIHSLTDKERSDIINDKRCITYHYNRKTRKKEVKDYDQNMIVVLTVWEALDDDFKETIKGINGEELEEDEKVKIFFDNIPMGDLAFLQEAIHKISGIDVESVELVKKDFGLLASRKKTLLKSLLGSI